MKTIISYITSIIAFLKSIIAGINALLGTNITLPEIGSNISIPGLNL